MQIFRFAVVRLRGWTLGFLLLGVLPLSQFITLAAPAKVHVVVLGTVRKVPFVPPEAASVSGKPTEPVVLKIRALTLDGHQKEWTTGDAHDVTDRSFTIRRALRLNDALPGEPPRWS